MSNPSRNIIIPHSSYILDNEIKKQITSIRIAKLEEKKKFEISFLNNASLVEVFVTAKLGINVVSFEESKLNAIEFVQNTKKKKYTIYIDGDYPLDMFSDYINSMLI